METTTFLDLDCIRLKNDALELLVTRSVGPRIIYLSRPGGDNLLAELPGLTLDCPDADPLNLWGGHRLWHAPELRRRTYLPDNQPLSVTEIDHGLEVVQPIEPPTGIQKSLRIMLPDQAATVIIDHTLTNHGMWPVELAPWAITQLKPGGTAILPQFTANADADGLLPNRRIALWPYTDIRSPHITWGNRYILVHANMTANSLKIGFPNPDGWLAYHIDHTLFVKQAAYHPNADYLDFGSSSECYCCGQFIELETLGPRTTLGLGQSVTHRETWQLHVGISFEPSEDAAQALAERLGLVVL
ncbi:MAG: hypothetical protein H6631_06090 [Anaerolineaceae bacterium]|nr:hypothetical protein [Anaerolineaceae bacterium]MCB9100359.1 hypothetical protein [Anaerolineales bacterium]